MAEPQAKKRKLNPKSFLPSDTSFEQAMRDNTFFADKSRLIPFLEEERNVIFCRPRRFGKSLILQMLMTYFDIKTDDAKFNKVDIYFIKFFLYGIWNCNSSFLPCSSSSAPSGLGGKMGKYLARQTFRASSSSSL